MQQSLSTLTPLSLIQTNRIVFNRKYTFSMKISSGTKTIQDDFDFTVQSPLLSDYLPLKCLAFSLSFRNSLPIFNQTTNNVTIMFNNNNFTTVSYAAPTVSASACTSQFSSNIATIMFTTFDNPYLLGDMRSYVFNSTAISFSASLLSSSLGIVPNQSITSYAYLYNTLTKAILGYQYVTVTFSAGSQTLFAQFAQPFVQVGLTDILYIDGTPSFDKLGNASSSFKYLWSLNGYPGITFPNSWVLSVPPSTRDFYGINQAGQYYTFSLIVQMGSRSSLPSQVVVQIEPGPDPNYCVTLSQKSIDIIQVMSYTNLPLLLQIVVTKNQNCSGIDLESLVWRCPDVSWQFWNIFGNNNTITISRPSMQQLPKSKNISLVVTQYYLVGSIEYTTQLDFTLFMQTEDLVAKVNYPQVFNPRELSNLVLDASQSYDPAAAQKNTTDVPVVCQWTCSSIFSDLCSSGGLSNDGCMLTIPSANILSSIAYSTQISGQLQQFNLKITKDTRVTTRTYYVTVIDSNNFPSCRLTLQSAYENSINLYQWVTATCNNTVGVQSSKFTYQWTLQTIQGTSLLSETNQLITNMPSLRIPPYILSAYYSLLIKLTVSASSQYSTPIGLFFQDNDQQYFTQGSVSVNFNSFTSYLSPFTMIPQAWYSGLSSELFFQYRIKEGPYNYRVLMTPQTNINFNPITSFLPPLTYENAIYIDVIDTLGNFVTVQQPVISRPNVLMTANQFAINVNSVTQKIIYDFTEEDLETSLYQLKLYFMAYELQQLDTQSQPASFFTILSQSAVQYLYNTFFIEQRLQQVTSFERAALINQHIIEIVYSITSQQRGVIGDFPVQQALTVVNQAVQYGNFTLGNMLPDITSKLFQIAFNTLEANSAINGTGKTNTYDFILNKVLKSVQTFLYSGETISSNVGPFSFSVTKLSSSSSSLQNLSDFSYNQQEIFGRVANPTSTLMVLAKNSTFAFATLYDSNINQLKMSLLTNKVQITFSLSSSQLGSYVNGTLKIFCAARSGFSDPWSTTAIAMNSVNNSTGLISCSANHFSQYALFTVTLAPVIVVPINNNTVDPTKITNQTSGGSTTVTVVGTWNDSLQNASIINSQFGSTPIILEESSAINYAALGVLAFFILTHFFFRLRYKGENQFEEQRDLKLQFIYDATKTRCQNFLRLFLLVLINFSPYLNIFLVYNQFIPRWVRNLIIQNYFMVISLGFGIYAALASNQLAPTSDSTLTGIFFIIISAVVLLRPWGIKVLYKLLYEPYSRVQDFQDNDSPDNLKSSNGIYVAEVAQDGEFSNGSDKKVFNSKAKKNNMANGPLTDREQQLISKDEEKDLDVILKQGSFLPSIFPPSVDDPSKLPQIGLKAKPDFAQFSHALDEFDIEGGKGKMISGEEGELNWQDEEIGFSNVVKKDKKTKPKQKKKPKNRVDTEQSANDGSLRDALLQKYRQLVDNGEGLTDDEKKALLEEMAERLDRMNKQLRQERGDQDANLQDALALRRKKQQGLKAMLNKATENADEFSQDYLQRLSKLALEQEEQLAQLEQELAKERLHALQKIDKDIQLSRTQKLSEIEGQLDRLRKSGVPEDSEELARLLEKYRKLALKVDAELQAERELQSAALEARLQKLRESRIKDFEKLWKELERLESNILSENAQLRNEIAQIKQLIKPVAEEDARLEALLAGQKLKSEQVRLDTEDQEAGRKEAANYQRKIELISEEEDGKVNRLLDDIANSPDKALKDQEAKKLAIQSKLADIGNSSPEERRRLLMQLDGINKAIDDYQKRAAAEQDSRLEEALQNRRKRKQKAVEDLSSHQQERLIEDSQAKAEKFLQANFGSSIKDPKVDDTEVKASFEKLKSSFSNEEMVHAIEKYLEQKGLRELQEVILHLQQQRAESLKDYIFQLMLQKQTQFELIREEYLPRYQLLKEHKDKGLISSEQAYQAQLDALREEENTKKLDIELQINEMEHKLEEELDVQAVQARTQAEAALRTRQARERAIMLELLQQQNQGNDSIIQYLMNERRDIERELALYKKQLDLELERKLKEINDARAQREKELQDKEDQLLNWEQRLKEEEAKQAALFKKQKQALLAKKKAEQSSELYRGMTYGNIEAMKFEHMKAMLALESAIEKEQQRQMDLMHAKLRARLIENGQEKVRRQVKLNMMIKEKEKLQAERLKKPPVRSPEKGRKSAKPLKIQDIDDSFVQKNGRKTQGPTGVNFYQDNEEEKDDGDLQQYFEGGEDEEEKEIVRDSSHKDSFILDRSDGSHEVYQSQFAKGQEESPVTAVDFARPMSSLDQNTEAQFQKSPKHGRRSLKLKSEDNIIEQTMNITHQSSDGMYSPKNQSQPLFISKFIGKALVIVMWIGLMASNMIAVTQMHETQFKDWVTVSIVGFVVIILVIDPLVYLILTYLMMRRQLNLVKPEDPLKLGSDFQVDYFTGKSDDRRERSRCSNFFVVSFVGREKMRDLKRRLSS